MKKNVILIFGGMIIVLMASMLVSAACCERLPNQGLWCQAADSVDECDQEGYGFRSDLESCDTFVKCHGTCVNENTGECSSSPELECEENGGNWYQESEENLPVCQQGCCVAGEYAYFVNSVECKDLATTFGINTDFRDDLTSVGECSALITATVTGACVVSSEVQDACIITTNTDCTENNAAALSENLGGAAILSGLEIDFYPGLLCTAPELSDCAKSEITECKDNKVYYKDTCGNFANIYDSTQYQDADYWTYIKQSYDSDICDVTRDGSSSCGNCETTENTVCRNQRDASEGNPEQGDYVCGDLTCDYEGIRYQHGESWCAGTNGALARYIIDDSGVTDRGLEHRLLTDGFSGETTEETISLLKDQDTYNTPGSRYFKLICSFGEVLVEECKEYRNNFCTEFVQENENAPNQAVCKFNKWRKCFQMVTKDQCNDALEMCKWIPGYRWDFQIVSEADRSQQQGSCVPLVAPGWDFWNPGSQGMPLCEMGTIQEHVLYEVSGVFNNREKWYNKNDEKKLANRCYDKCYAIPDYGIEYEMGPDEEKMYPEEIECSESISRNDDRGNLNCGERGLIPGCTNYQYLTEFYDESECFLILPDGVTGTDFEGSEDSNNGVHLSDRKGQYCHKKDDPNYYSTGEITRTAYDCTNFWGSEVLDEERERDYPIYLTHNEWLNGMTERIRSVGDCGYKPNLEGVYSSDESEIITAIFQILDQDLEVKRNVTAEQIIYKAKVDVSAESEVMKSPVELESYSCSEQGGFCVYGGADKCVGSVMEGESLCPHQSLCCVSPELGGDSGDGGEGV
jgi:hypothetical protein